MKGIVLAGGTGSRLHPITRAVSKQLVPVYDKPMIYYPVSTLLLAGIRDILIISNPESLPHIQALLGDGSQLGIDISYLPQDRPRGIAEALIIGEDHIGDDSVALILGDNIFHGETFGAFLRHTRESFGGCVLFGCRVSDPENYGIADIDSAGRLVRIEEKPVEPKSDIAVPGLYFYDKNAPGIAKNVTPSARGELEITSVNNAYVESGRARLIPLERQISWIDAGSPQSLFSASQYIQSLAQWERTRVGCLEEVALRMGLIDRDQCYNLGWEMKNSVYGKYLMDIAQRSDDLVQR